MINIEFSKIKSILIKKRILLTSIAGNYIQASKILSNQDELELKYNRINDKDICMFPNKFKIEPYSAFFAGKSFCSMGCYSCSNSPLPEYVTIGRYCSIAKNLSFFGFNHPIDFVTTNSITYDSAYSPSHCSLFDNKQNEQKLLKYNNHWLRDASVKIGNDVWIGSDVSIKRGIKISDGAIIAAHAVVCNDTPPYAIVGGVPAKIIRYRFDESIIKGLIETQWWNYDYNDLIKLSLDNPKLFIKEISLKKDLIKEIDFSAEDVLTNENLLSILKDN